VDRSARHARTSAANSVSIFGAVAGSLTARLWREVGDGGVDGPNRFAQGGVSLFLRVKRVVPQG